MSNTAQSSFLSKTTPPAFLRAIQGLIIGFIVMVGAQIPRVNRLDLSAMLVFVLLMLVGILFASTLKARPNNQQ